MCAKTTLVADVISLHLVRWRAGEDACGPDTLEDGTVIVRIHLEIPAIAALMLQI